jgi:hypothetical protein
MFDDRLLKGAFYATCYLCKCEQLAGITRELAYFDLFSFIADNVLDGRADPVLVYKAFNLVVKPWMV